MVAADRGSVAAFAVDADDWDGCPPAGVPFGPSPYLRAHLVATDGDLLALGNPLWRTTATAGEDVPGR